MTTKLGGTEMDLPEEIHVSIDLPALEYKLSLNIQRLSHFVAGALSSSPSTLTEPLQAQGSIVAFQYSPAISWTTEQAAAEFRNWVLLNAFRDLAEVMTHFLGSVQSTSTAAILQETQTDAGHITSSQWKQFVVDGERRFEKANLPDKLRILTTERGLEISEDAVTHIQSLYRVRNCLVHRVGLVQDADADSDGFLRAAWLTLKPYIVTEDGEEPLALPHYLKKAGHLLLRRELSVKVFRLGDRVAFTAEEFHDIAHGAFLAGTDTIKALEQRLRQAGIPMSNPPAASA